MLQEKNQLRVVVEKLRQRFPLLYSEFRSQEFSERVQLRTPSTPIMIARQSSQKQYLTLDSNFSTLSSGNAEEAGTHSWRKFLTAVRTRWLDSALY